MTAEREDFDQQKKRILNTLDEGMKKYVEHYGTDEDTVKVDISKILARSEVSRNTMYSRGYQWTLDNYAGCSYKKNQGKFIMKPVTWLRNRGKLEEVEQEA